MKEEEVIRYLTENQFSKIMEKSEVLGSFTRTAIGLYETVYLVLVPDGKKKKLRVMGKFSERFEGRTRTSHYIEYISIPDSIDQFHLTILQIEEMVEPARKIFLDVIEKEDLPDF
ncbi:hypothetical protein [Mycobacterium sp.]|uniref:hypothetical protein n=1 Tax=Mycobacterium sp. TaxID=1785 RepID=UPI0031DD6FC6